MFGVAVILTTLFCCVFSGKEWCDLPCGKELNTVCLHEEKTSTPECGKIVNSMNEKTREDLLEAHNKYRNDFAGGKMGWPKAANMRLLTWDDDLQKGAQRWASQCIFEHDKCRRTSQFEYVGQNLLQLRSPATPSTSADTFHSWTDEISSASTDIIDNYKFSFGTGHFTQIIWASTYKVGCGEITYSTAGNNGRTLACNYGPTGNFIDQPIYKKGEPCTQCPEGTRCSPNSKYPNLCA